MNSLPVILVSAKTEADAEYIISKLLEGEETEAGAGGARVWRLSNKYYRASVVLRAAPDPAPDDAAPDPTPDDAAPDDTTPDGHLLFLTHDEVTAGGVAAAERRAAAGAGAGVRVLAADAARLDGALLGWAARRRVEPVALRSEGAAAVRAALHAHPWRGLQRRPPAAPEQEREEEWLAALGALAPAAAAARALSGAERLAAAESVLAAFCRAIGEDMDEL